MLIGPLNDLLGGLGPVKRHLTCFKLMFIDFYKFLLNIYVLYMGIEPGWWRISPGYILKYF